MKRMPSVMGTRFNKVPQADISRSSFNRSHGHKTTFDAGFLVPIYIDEALPGDTFNLKMSAFARLATPLKPIMDNLYMDSFFFAVPYRLVWDNWHKFMGEQEQPGDSVDFVIPQQTVPSGGYNSNTLEDYMGMPVAVDSYTHSALPIRAYKLIYNEWFRDQNLQPAYTIQKGDGPDTPAAGGSTVETRGKRHDYFTSCLPWPQKGDAVTIPIGASAAPVVEADDTKTPIWRNNADTVVDVWLGSDSSGTNPTPAQLTSGTAPIGATEPVYWEDPNLEADLTAATATSINTLREAFQIQKLLERDARGGTRYTEIIKSHFGVTSPDARLQRPEYLGGGSTPVIVSPIAQTSAGDTQPTPQGNLAAIGTASVSGHGFVKSFTEHCLLLGMVCVRADLTYQQGLERMWSRSTRYDFFWPAFSGLGEQAVLNKEIYMRGLSTDEDAFGYQERHAEYRYKPSRISGLFRSGVSSGETTIDYWHLSQRFTAMPTLNDTFISEDPPIERIVAVTTEPEFLFDSYFDLTCARPMPVYGVPGLIDHF